MIGPDSSLQNAGFGKDHTVPVKGSLFFGFWKSNEKMGCCQWNNTFHLSSGQLWVYKISA